MAITPALPGLDITPAVANTDALRKVEVQARGRVENHPRTRLAARTVIGIIVGAHHDVVQRQPRAQRIMQPVDLVAGLFAPSDVRLVGHDDERKSQLPQTITSLDDAGQHAQVLHTGRRMRGAVTHVDLVEHPVTVQENRGAGADGGALADHASNRPARASMSIAAIESRRAS